MDLIERSAEVGRLGDLVGRVIDEGDGRAAVIQGSAGIGKTSLLVAVARRATSGGARVLSARGTELESKLTFGVVRELLGPGIERLSAPERAAVLDGPAAPAARRVLEADFPVDATAVEADGDPIYGLARLVWSLAELQPLVLAVDDIQWLDPSSAMFLAYVGRRVAGRPVLILAAHRDDAPGPADAAVADFVRSAESIRLAPLSVDGVGRMLAGALPSVSNELAAACWKATGGTPYLVDEVARALAGLPEPDRLSAVARIAPESIGRDVLDRVRRVSGTAADLAEAIALFPNGTTLADAAAIADTDVATAAGAADTLVSAGVIAPGATLAFRQPVVRAAVLGQIGLFRRRQAHARAAGVLLAGGADLEEVADQLLAAEPSGQHVHVRALEAAATRAERAGASSAAVRYLARALDEPPAPADRGRIRRQLGRLELAVDPAAAVDHLSVGLREAETASDRIDIAVDLASAYLAVGRADDAAETLLSVRDAAGAADRERTLIVEATLASAAWESTRHADIYASVAGGLPRDLPGATAGQRLALTTVAYTMFDDCQPHAQVVDVLRRIVGSRDPAAPRSPEMTDVMNLLISCGALDDAEAICRRWESRAQAVGPESLYVSSQLGLARILWYRGDVRGCEAVARLGLELPAGNAEARAALGCWIASVQIAEGAFGDASSALDLAQEHGTAFGVDIVIEARRAQIAIAEGRPGDALEILERFRAGLEQRGAGNPSDNLWLVDLVEAQAATGRRDDALGLAERLLVNAERFGEPRAVGLLRLAVGRWRGGPEGLRDLERAVHALAPSRYRHEEARARLELGSALRRANQRSAAVEHLKAALDYGHRQRLRPMTDRAEEELRAAGARPRRRAVRGADALTPSEARIARLAADGMTNREIAAHLFLTVKTVETHLANVFGKLEVSSRRQLPKALDTGSPAA